VARVVKVGRMVRVAWAAVGARVAGEAEVVR